MADQTDDRSGRRPPMQSGDWLHTAVNMVAGVFLGAVLNRLAGLMTLELWPVLLLVPIVFGVVLLIDGAFERLFQRLFPSGIRPARTPAPRRRKPLLRLLSLPVGIATGVALARLGLGEGILGLVT